MVDLFVRVLCLRWEWLLALLTSGCCALVVGPMVKFWF